MWHLSNLQTWIQRAMLCIESTQKASMYTVTNYALTRVYHKISYYIKDATLCLVVICIVSSWVTTAFRITYQHDLYTFSLMVYQFNYITLLNRIHLADATAHIVFHVCTMAAVLKNPTLLITQPFKITFNIISLMLHCNIFTFQNNSYLSMTSVSCQGAIFVSTAWCWEAISKHSLFAKGFNALYSLVIFSLFVDIHSWKRLESSCSTHISNASPIFA